MIVMPALAGGDIADKEIVAAVVGRVVAAIAPQMRDRIHRPGRMPHRDGAQRPAPHEQAGAELIRLIICAAHQQARDKADREQREPHHGVELHPVLAALEHRVIRIAQKIAGVAVVHYRGLHVGRPHQQPAEMRPDETLHRRVRRMRVQFDVGIVVMAPMHRHPEHRRELQAAGAERGEGVFEPQRTCERAVREKAMKADIDSEHAENEHADDENGDPGPAEPPGKQRARREKVNDDKSDQIICLELQRPVRIFHTPR